MSIVVTGATGHLGRLVVEDLLSRGVPAGDIVATGRNIAALGDLEVQGVHVRRVVLRGVRVGLGREPQARLALLLGGERGDMRNAQNLGRRSARSIGSTSTAPSPPTIRS